MEHGDKFTRGGYTFKLTIEPDESGDPPWKNEDGHGPVRGWVPAGEKRPGELILQGTRHGNALLYDYAEACKIALRDEWGTQKIQPETKAGKAYKASIAAREDFNRLKAFCNGEWSYVGAIVTLCDDDGETPRPLYRESLWGIESDATDYFEEVAHELADQIIDRIPGAEPRGAGADDGRDFTPPYEP